MPTVFLSYAREDLEHATRIAEQLAAEDVTVWRDQEQLYVGQAWPKALGEAIAKTDAVLLLWSGQAAGSQFVELEWCTALALKRTILPCLLDQTPLPPSLAAIEAAGPDGIAAAIRRFVAAHTGETKSSDQSRVQEVVGELAGIEAGTPGEVLQKARTVVARFRVFVSHKHDDHALAETVKKTLEGLSGRIDCFVSGSDLSAGSDWNAEIRSQLAQSHLLILLFTEPSRNWDWCLYEAGLFTSLDEAEEHPVVCLYRSQNALPSPLTNLQGVPVEAVPLRRFLSQLCKETWRIAKEWRLGALSPRVPQKIIEGVSDRIIKAFSPKIITALPNAGREDLIYHPCHRLVLDLGAVEKIDAGIPREAVVVEGDGATSNFTLTLFNLASGRLARTWGDLVDAAGGGDTTWLTDLDQHFVAALHEELFLPSTSMIQLWDTWRLHRRSYRPILYQIVREGRHRLGAGSSPAPLGRPLQVTIVLDPVSGTNQGNATSERTQFR